MTTCCLPCSSIVVEESMDCGRLVRAQSPISAGQIVIENLPTAQMLLASVWGERCLNCFHSSNKLLACVKCKRATYCSRECQTKDWSQHKVECKHLNKFWDNVNMEILNELFILLRLSAIEKTMESHCKLISQSESGNTVPVPPTTPTQIVLCGKEHTHGLHLGTPVKNIEDNFSQVVIGLACEITKRTPNEISYWLRQFRSNNFGITDELMNCIGIGVYPSAALLNHSCAPNCILRYHLQPNGPVVQIVAIRDILPGEELTHSYIDCSLPKFMRQDRLMEIYGFSCSCQLCCSSANNFTAGSGAATSSPCMSIKSCIDQYLMADSRLLNPLGLKNALEAWRTSQEGITESNKIPCFDIDEFLTQTLQSEIPWKQAVMDKILNQLDVDMIHAEDENMLMSCLTRMQKIEEKFYSFYGPFHLELHKLRGKMLSTYLLLGDNEGAYRICSQVVSYLTLSLINMQKHPLLGVQLFTLGDLAGLCNHYEQAKAYYEWCFETLSISHIKEEELMAKLLENMAELECKSNGKQ